MFLNETMHYPKFLDTFKLDVGTRVCEKLKDMASNGIEHTSFTVSLNNEYVDTIEVDASLDFDCDPSDKRWYFASYFNHYDRCKDGRIHEPTLTVVCPAKGGEFDVSKLFYRVSHELTHLYDDWNSVRNGNGSICRRQQNVDTTKFIGGAINGNNDVLKNVAMLSYMSLKTEQQAFLSQTVQELESLGCNLWNYKEVLKKTDTYRNIAVSYRETVSFIRNAGYDQLRQLNWFIVIGYQKASIPKLNIGNFDAERYRTMLLKWAERVYHGIMKSYGSVVQYYLDQLNDGLSKKRTYFTYD